MVPVYYPIMYVIHVYIMNRKVDYLSFLVMKEDTSTYTGPLISLKLRLDSQTLGLIDFCNNQVLSAYSKPTY